MNISFLCPTQNLIELFFRLLWTKSGEQVLPKISHVFVVTIMEEINWFSDFFPKASLWYVEELRSVFIYRDIIL